MTLIDWLIMYALPNEPVDAEEAMAMCARKYEELARDPDYLYWSIRKYPNEVLMLSRYIGHGGMFPPPGMSWPEWIRAFGFADEL